ncbi:Manganese transport protein MntH [Leclercia adecarboxylata]|uniref:Manganese transport protein MntH n=1 Tax=Leclercia adecarboxylata TaxID=83655 RepID=A0A4U9IBP6_9ENTR|nr:Manganese transport protein MntH [Leclercia adecarboxylata]
MSNSRVDESSSGKAARKMRFALMGPAFIAAIGYIDPGNFATNIQAGASFGYKLLWVVVWANLMAMMIQVLSAKLGIATGKNLAEQIRDHYPRPLVWFYWVQAEIIAMATDLAEFIGAAIGFKLILGVSLLQGAVLTGIATFLILMLQRRGQKTARKSDWWPAAVCGGGLYCGADLLPAGRYPTRQGDGDPEPADD